MIAVVTDSNSQIPPSLAQRFGITIVPLSVTVDGVTYLEGVDLDADGFYARFDGGAPAPAVSTAQPSPGQFAAAYEAVERAGADAILSVHIGSNVSGTVNSARLAAAAATVPVRIVDTGTASFAVALCAWAAAEAIATGADLDAAATAAEHAAAGAGNVFILEALDLARAGGRLAAGAGPPSAVPVLTMAGGVMHVVAEATDLDEAVRAMVAAVAGAATGPSLLRVGVGTADAAMAAAGDHLEVSLAELPAVGEVVRYRIGPSVGAHTGPGTAGVMFAPARS